MPQLLRVLLVSVAAVALGVAESASARPTHLQLQRCRGLVKGARGCTNSIFPCKTQFPFTADLSAVGGGSRRKTQRFVVSKEFPDVTFRYRIDGDTIMFEPEIPDRCSTFRCLWSVAVAYPGQTWRRAS
jgi:hypothetical protein